MWVKKKQLEPDMEQLTGSRLGKELVKDVYCHCLFNLYAEYIMQSARLDESQAGIKINLKYTDNIILMAESEEELKSLLMRVKEESEKDGLKLNMKKLRL